MTSRRESIDRAWIILMIAVGGGGLLGFVTVLHHPSFGLVAPDAVLIGVAIALLIAPATILALWNKRLELAVPLLYGATAIVGLACGWTGDPLISMGGPAWFFFAMQIFTRLIVPDIARPTGKPCPNCGYDLRGLDHERCPECGRVCKPDAGTVADFRRDK